MIICCSIQSSAQCQFISKPSIYYYILGSSLNTTHLCLTSSLPQVQNSSALSLEAGAQALTKGYSANSELGQLETQARYSKDYCYTGTGLLFSFLAHLVSPAIIRT